MKLLVLALLLGASARAAGTPETYSVRTGDTASSIAAAHYGDPRLGSLLLAYNERPASAVLVDGAVANRDDLALLRLLFGRVGEDDAACGRLLLLDRLDDQPVPEGLQLHP